jgi:LPS sulfotransferase NodH
LSIEGIKTGHEEIFDWPIYTGAPLPYILASVPRTGSTYLSHLLWKTGCLGAPLEYLNFQPSGPQGSISELPKAQHELWRRTIVRRTSPNGLFGVKAFPLQLEELGRANPALLASAMRFLLRDGPDSKVVQLRRRDSDAHAISLARASLSGIWRAEQEPSVSNEPGYSEALVVRAKHELTIQERAWQQMFGETGITPLILFYEDVVEKPDDAVMRVADYLNVDIDPSQAVSVPEIRRQDQTGAKLWRARYAKSKPLS